MYGVKKFHEYLYGCKFTLVTDHKPLLANLGPKRNLPTLAAARLQRWAIFLLGYQYDLEFRPTGNHYADGFSRLPRPMVEGDDTEVDFGASACNLLKIETLPLECRRLLLQTTYSARSGDTCRRAGQTQLHAAELKPYASRKGELSIDRGCVFYATQVVIPAKCQARVLKELHIGHQEDERPGQDTCMVAGNRPTD